MFQFRTVFYPCPGFARAYPPLSQLSSPKISGYRSEEDNRRHVNHIPVLNVSKSEEGLRLPAASSAKDEVVLHAAYTAPVWLPLYALFFLPDDGQVPTRCKITELVPTFG